MPWKQRWPCHPHPAHLVPRTFCTQPVGHFPNSWKWPGLEPRALDRHKSRCSEVARSALSDLDSSDLGITSLAV